MEGEQRRSHREERGEKGESVESERERHKKQRGMTVTYSAAVRPRPRPRQSVSQTGASFVRKRRRQKANPARTKSAFQRGDATGDSHQNCYCLCRGNGNGRGRGEEKMSLHSPCSLHTLSLSCDTSYVRSSFRYGARPPQGSLFNTCKYECGHPSTHALAYGLPSDPLKNVESTTTK